MVKNFTKKSIFIYLFCLSASINFVYAASNNLSEILKAPDVYDGRVVEITGEVIGEELKADNGIWINISSGPEAIGVFSSNRQSFTSIKHWGAYGERGDRVTVSGIFHKNFISGGASAIYLNSIKIVQQGFKNNIKISLIKQQLALVLFGMCSLSGIIYFIKIKLWKKNSKV